MDYPLGMDINQCPDYLSHVDPGLILSQSFALDLPLQLPP